MSKIKTAFFCQHCGYEAAKWTGKCPSCGQWNTLVEEKVVKKDVPLRQQEWKTEVPKGYKTVNLDDVNASEEKKWITQDAELNRVLGGGIVAGSIVLVGGEPGIGKSTLFLQNALQLSHLIRFYHVQKKIIR